MDKGEKRGQQQWGKRTHLSVLKTIWSAWKRRLSSSWHPWSQEHLAQPGSSSSQWLCLGNAPLSRGFHNSPKYTRSPQEVPRPRGKLYHVSWQAKWCHHPTRGIYDSLYTWAKFRNPSISRKTRRVALYRKKIYLLLNTPEASLYLMNRSQGLVRRITFHVTGRRMNLVFGSSILIPTLVPECQLLNESYYNTVTRAGESPTQ